MGVVARAALGTLALLVAVGCSARRPVVLSETADGSSIELQTGQSLTLDLPGNPTTGYAWEISGEVPPILRLVEAPTLAPATDESPRIGVNRRTLVRFRAVTTGSGLVALAYRRPWEAMDTAAKTFRCSVTVR